MVNINICGKVSKKDTSMLTDFYACLRIATSSVIAFPLNVFTKICTVGNN